MKITIIGASGFVGKATVKEALKNNHQVYAVSRNGSFDANDNLTVINHDITDWEGLASKISDTDLIISTFNPGWTNPNLYTDFINGAHAINELAKKLSKRVIIVGGAGSLFDRSTNRQLFVDADEAFQNMVRGAYDLYTELTTDHSFDWTFVSPAVELTADEPNYNYNVGGDYVLYNANGESKISIYDLADLLIKIAPGEHLIHKRLTLANK
ncbi:NAD(P)-dependent oxidoreductase [Leuconostoc miyukkimchii]|uniref:NAD(P)-dependent oxidoreductase n=1 Tax=Leuconostoc miyukkimchii TaxID=910540 RepID=UPI001C7D1222|nr:NAD(P)H-binding protein [Leuconostoc miyukkimchii]